MKASQRPSEGLCYANKPPPWNKATTNGVAGSEPLLLGAALYDVSPRFTPRGVASSWVLHFRQPGGGSRSVLRGGPQALALLP